MGWSKTNTATENRCYIRFKHLIRVIECNLSFTSDFCRFLTIYCCYLLASLNKQTSSSRWCYQSRRWPLKYILHVYMIYIAPCDCHRLPFLFFKTSRKDFFLNMEDLTKLLSDLHRLIAIDNWQMTQTY